MPEEAWVGYKHEKGAFAGNEERKYFFGFKDFPVFFWVA